MLRIGRLQAGEWSQHSPDLAEVQSGLEVLDEGQYVALGGAGRVPPASTLMSDEDDLAYATPILQTVAGALPLVELPSRRVTLEQDGAAQPCPQRLQLCIAAHRSTLLL